MILDKAKMAHEWAMKHGKSDSIYDRDNMVDLAWDYADKMQAKEDERVKKKAIDDAKASKLFMDDLTIKPIGSVVAKDDGLYFDRANFQHYKVEDSKHYQFINTKEEWVAIDKIPNSEFLEYSES